MRLRRLMCTSSFLIVLVAAFAACSGGSRVAPPPLRISSAGAGVAAPASFANIKPAPGYPTPPPASGITFDPSAIPTPPAVTATTVPLPASIGDISAGPTAAQAQQLAALLPAPATTTLLFGTISAFGSNSVTITTSAPVSFDPSSAATASVTTSNGLDIPSSVSLVLAPTTLDGVPGGFGALHTGDAVLAIADTAHLAAPAAYLTDLTLLQSAVVPNQTATGLSSARTRLAAQTQSTGTTRKPAAVSFSNVAPFLLTGMTGPGMDVERLNNVGVPLPAVIPFFGLSLSVNTVVADVGTRAVFPLELADVSSVVPLVENQTATLPLSVLNVPSNGSATYTLNFYIAVDVGLTATLQDNLSGLQLPVSTTYSLTNLIGPQLSTGGHLLPGLGLQSGTTGPLPATGATLPFGVVRGLGITVDPVQNLVSLIAAEYPLIEGVLVSKGLGVLKYPVQLQFQFDGGISGGAVNGALNLTNGTPNLISSVAFQPDAVPGTSTQFTPVAPAGTSLPVSATFFGPATPPVYSGTVNYQIDFGVGTPNGNLPIVPIAVYSPGPYAFGNAVFQPAKPMVVLSPAPAVQLTCVETAPQHDNYCGMTLLDPKMPGFISGSNVGTLLVSEPGYSGAFTWNPAPPGVSPTLPTYESPACTNSYFAAAFTESPASASGQPAVFTFMQTQNLYGAEPVANIVEGGTAACQGIISDANGHSVSVAVGLDWNLPIGAPQP